MITPASVNAVQLDFQVGDRVEHKSFGAGTVSALTPMGGDYLMEVSFDNTGVKRLMARAAARMMKKL